MLLVMVRPRYGPNVVFRLSMVCSRFKFKFSMSIKIFSLKATSHGTSDLKNEFQNILPISLHVRRRSVRSEPCFFGR